ncbi:MAG: baseplate J/gp47 family protein [Cyanomargarita calcarea GSE-NOS-MK-12-04C]|jgi:hypothetical protein|uniref:Baseplate J/gp47 family protein n=1 Tax=Cyanomargarita calcarea GSE-NOS-MK-12-04C TaxID=2839659 RepID=A0A951QQT8_9CYAN|nr:baseplate J/gp47 family protein [Cyanomargarita calcarea GSE-NOS-MK-12-04C]
MPNPTQFTPLEAEPLYPADPKLLLQAMLDRCYIASDRTLNDFSAASPISALYEGHLFAVLEHLYYTNKLPAAMALEFLKIAGIQRRLGKAAQVNLTFTLSAPLGNPFYLSAGYLVSDSSNSYNFFTDEDLVIPSGAISGIVSATAENLGRTYNLPSYTIKNLSESRAFLQSVVNTEPSTGGIDEETVDEARARGFITLRRRGLTSADDYEQEAKLQLGEGSVARAVGLLAADKITFEKGAVHIFGLNPDGTQLNQAQINNLRFSLSSGGKAPIGVRVYASSIELVPLEVYAIASLLPGSNPEAIALSIYQKLQDYLQPGNLPLGQTIILKELEFQVKLAGVNYVQSVSTHTALNVSYADIPLPNAYSAAHLFDLTLDLVLDGQTFTFSYGEGGDLD